MKFYNLAIWQCKFFRNECRTKGRFGKLVKLIASEPSKNATLADTTAAHSNQLNLGDAIVVLVHAIVISISQPIYSQCLIYYIKRQSIYQTASQILTKVKSLFFVSNRNKIYFHYFHIKSHPLHYTQSSQVQQPEMLNLCSCCMTEDQILNNVSKCDRHNIPFMFLCLNDKDLACVNNPLMCHECLAEHKGHPFETIQKHFTPQFRNILRQGTSMNGPAMVRLIDHLMADFQKMRAKLNNQLNRFENVLRDQLKKLKPKYPVSDKFGIPGTEINRDNILILLDIERREKNHIWVPASQKYMRSLVGHVTTMIENLIGDLEQSIAGKPYETLSQVQSATMIEQFLEKYQGRFDTDMRYFQWSQHEKHDNVKVHQNGLIAKYVHNSPAKPAALISNPLIRTMSKVYIKIIKLPTTAVIFDASTVALGACVPTTAKIFGYKQLIQPSHGAFMIASNGKCYHSSLQKYTKKSLSFGFTQGDTIKIEIDFDKKRILFSKWGFFERHFDMELTVKDEQLYMMKPCVMFHGEVGAMVHIVNEEVYKRKDHQEVFQV